MTTPLENRLLAPEGRLRLSAAPQAEIAAPVALRVGSAETLTIDASDRMTGGERKRLDGALDVITRLDELGGGAATDALDVDAAMAPGSR